MTIGCPGCGHAIRHATEGESHHAYGLLQDWYIVKKEEGIHLIICDACGWFETIDYYETWRPWYEQLQRALQKGKKL